jgi:hypothetical protein
MSPCPALTASRSSPGEKDSRPAKVAGRDGIGGDLVSAGDIPQAASPVSAEHRQQPAIMRDGQEIAPILQNQFTRQRACGSSRA